MPNRDLPKVTLEDLLRLKRSERPSSDFWAGFEQALRAKQLSALVSRRSWWSVSWLGVRAGLVRLVAPLGAATALALAVFSSTANQSTAPLPLATRPVIRVASAASAVPLVSVEMRPQVGAPSSAPASAVVAADPVSASQPPMAVVVKTEDPAGGSRPAVAALTTPWTVNAVTADPTPPIAVTANPLPVPADFSVAALLPELNLPSVGVFADNPPPGKKNDATAPVARQTMAMWQPAAVLGRQTAVTEAKVRESVSRRLSDDLLYASSRRLVGVAGSSVSVRF